MSSLTVAVPSHWWHLGCWQQATQPLKGHPSDFYPVRQYFPHQGTWHLLGRCSRTDAPGEAMCRAHIRHWSHRAAPGEASPACFWFFPDHSSHPPAPSLGCTVLPGGRRRNCCLAPGLPFVQWDPMEKTLSSCLETGHSVDWRVYMKTVVSRKSLQCTNVAPKMHISLGLTLKTQLRVKNSVIQEIPPDINLTTRDESSIKIRQTHTWNGHDTHLVSESLFGAKLTLAVTGSLSGMGRVWGRGTEPNPAGPHGPRAEGKRDSWLPGWGGRGWQSPEFPSWDTWVWTCLLGGAQSTAGRSDCFSNNHIPSQQEGQECGQHTSSLLEGPVEDFHLASV